MEPAHQLRLLCHVGSFCNSAPVSSQAKPRWDSGDAPDAQNFKFELRWERPGRDTHQVHEHGPGHVAATAGLIEVHVHPLQLQVALSLEATIGIDAVFVADYLRSAEDRSEAV